jgi:hypothetical protein
MRDADFYLFLIYCDFIRDKWVQIDTERRIEWLVKVANKITQSIPSMRIKQCWLAMSKYDAKR